MLTRFDKPADQISDSERYEFVEYHKWMMDASFFLPLPADMVVNAEHQLQKVVVEREMQTIPTETRALLGDPFSGICQFAEQQHSDLIIMGSHGRTGLAHVFLGSVAERVVRHASCPVLVVRLPHTGTD